jgi:hypothetical protein
MARAGGSALVEAAGGVIPRGRDGPGTGAERTNRGRPKGGLGHEKTRRA